MNPVLFTHEEIDSYVLRGTEALERYRTEHILNGSDKTLGAEMPLNYLFNHKGVRVRFNCRVDRIFIDGDGVLHAVDFKFSFAGRIPTPESLYSSLRAFLCHVLVRKRFPQYERVKLGFLNVLSDTSSMVEFTPEQGQLNREELWQQVQRIFAKDFTPKISEHCNWCAFRDLCPALNQTIGFDEIC
jgi:RecB family exonuclease